MTLDDEKAKTLRRLAKAICDATPVNWDAESHDHPAIASSVKALRLIESVAEVHRADTGTDSGRAPELSADSEPAARRFLFQWGPLEVIERIGAGSFGEVYRAFDPHLQRQVALKLRRPGAGTDEEASARRVLDEARRLARVRHPNVLTVYGVDVHDGRAGMWTDFVRGCTLEERLTEAGPFAAHEAALIGLDLCRALAAVHAAGLVHGDLKAANVMREEGGRILLMDFGAASERLGVPLGAARIGFGTPLITAPEILRGEARGPAADIYSLGALLFRLVSGRYPVEATTAEELAAKHDNGDQASLRDLRPDLPVAFVELVERALAHDPGSRFPSAGALERDLVAATGLLHATREAQTLRSLLDDLGRVPEELCRHIGREVARALATIHRTGRQHGDLRPQTILITGDGTVEVMKPGPHRDPARALRYTAPELVHGNEAVDGRTDLYALGAILYELATGHHPFSGEDSQAVLRRIQTETPRRVGELNPQFSPFFEEVIRNLLEKDPGRRFGSAAQLVQVLVEGERAAWWRRRSRELRQAARRPLRRVRVPLETALYGRAGELQRLRDSYERARSGDGQVVLVDGEAGIGKTRLIHEFVAELVGAGDDLNFLHGSYPPGGAATAAGAFTTAYREHFGIEGLEETLEDYLKVTPLLIPAFAALLRGDPAPPGGARLTKESLQTAFVHLSQELAAERPTVILIDDLHFSPEEGRSLFAALALAVPGHRLMLIGNARSGTPEDWSASMRRLEHVSALPLPRLAAEEVRRLVIDAFGAGPLAEELAPQIATRSDGNPFFVFEIIRELRERGLVARLPGGAWAPAGPIGEVPIPSTVLALIQARIGRLDQEDRELLDVASCWGFEFDPTLVAETVGRGVVHTLRRFARMEERERLIRAAGRCYEFDHHQVQEALYEQLLEPLRQRYHGALADALERRKEAGGKSPKVLDGVVAVELCQHFYRGGCSERAHRYLQAALDHLEAHYMNGAALELADRALAAATLQGPERLDVLLRKLRRLRLLGRLNEVPAVLDAAEALADAGRERRVQSQVARERGIHLIQTARYDEARSALQSAIELARSAGDLAEEGLASQRLGAVHYSLGQFEEARSHYERSIAIAEQVNDRRQEGDANLGLGIVFRLMGLHQESKERFDRALALAVEQGDRVAEATATGNLGVVFLDMGRYEDARACCERTLRLCRQNGHRSHELVAEANLGVALFELGHPGEALVHQARQLALSRETGQRDPEAIALCNQGIAYALFGDFDRAQRLLEASRSLCAGAGLGFEGQTLYELAVLEEYRGEVGGAERLYREALALFRKHEGRRVIALALVALGRLLAGLGRDKEAREHLTESLGLAQELDYAREAVLASIHLALLPGGDCDSALEVFRAHESRLSHYEKMRALFRLWEGRGDVSHLEEAHRLLMELRSHSPVEYQETMMANVPLHHEIRAAWATR
jgi:serine/threonine-protein kinase